MKSLLFTLIMVSQVSAQNSGGTKQGVRREIPQITHEDVMIAVAAHKSLRNQQLRLLQQIDENRYPYVLLSPRDPIPTEAVELLELISSVGGTVDPYGIVIANVVAELTNKGAITTSEEITQVVSFLRPYGNRWSYPDGEKPAYQDPEVEWAKDNWTLVLKVAGKYGDIIELSKSAVELIHARDERAKDLLAERLIQAVHGKDFSLRDRDSVAAVRVEPLLLLASQALAGPPGHPKTVLAQIALDRTTGGYTNHGNPGSPNNRYRYLTGKHLATQQALKTSAAYKSERDALARENKTLRSSIAQIASRIELREQLKLAIQLDSEIARMRAAAGADKELLELVNAVDDARKGMQKELSAYSGNDSSKQRFDSAQEEFREMSSRFTNALIIKATKTAQANDAVHAYVGLTRSMSRLIALSDPEGAKYFSATTELCGGLKLAFLAPETAPITIPTAIFNFFATLLGGPSDTELILKAIREVHTDLVKMRSQILAAQHITLDQLLKSSMRTLTMMAEGFQRIEREMALEFRNVRDMQMQSHAASHDMISAINEIRNRLERQAISQKSSSVRDTVRGVLNNSLTARPGLQQDPGFNDRMETIHACITRGLYELPPIRIKGRTVEDLATDDLRQLYRYLGEGGLTTDTKVSSLELLPVLNQVYSRLGHPLWDPNSSREYERTVPNAALWALAADSYLRFGESPDPKIQGWFQAFVLWRGDNIPGATTRAVLRPGEQAQEAVSRLRSDPKYLDLAFGSLRDQVTEMKKQVNASYQAALAGNDGNGDLHGGPFQRPWHKPGFSSTQEGLPTIYYLDEFAEALSQSGLTKELEQGVAIQDLEALIASISPDVINAEALGLGTLRLGISSATWIPTRKEYSVHFGNLLDWAQHRYGHLELELKLLLGKREIDTFIWRSPTEKMYEKRILFYSIPALVPDIEAYLKERDRRVYDSYRFSLKFHNMPMRGPKYSHFVKGIMERSGWDVNEAMTQIFTKKIGSDVFEKMPVSNILEYGRPRLYQEYRLTAGAFLAVPEQNREAADGIAKVIASKRWVDPIGRYVTEAAKDVTPELQKAAADFERHLRSEFGEFHSKLDMVKIDGNFLDGKELVQKIENCYEELKVRLTVGLRRRLEAQLNKKETREAAEALEKRLLAIVQILKAELLDPKIKDNEPTDHLPILVERRLRERSVLWEDSVRTAMKDKNGNAELRFSNCLSAYDGLRQLIQTSGQVVTALPEGSFPWTQLLATPNDMRPLPVTIEQLRFRGLLKSEDFVFFSRAGLPMYSPSGPDVFELWEKNINEAEADLRDRFYRAGPHPLLDSILVRGRALLEKEKASVKK